MGVWVRVCVRPEDEAFPVCGCVVRRVCEWVHLCGCVWVWCRGSDLDHLGEAGRVGGHGGQHRQHRRELKFYCRSHWLVDLVLSGLSTQYQIYRTKFIEYLNDTRTW